MSDHGHDHDHDHANTVKPMVDEITDFEVLEIALRELCIEKGLFTAAEHRLFTEFAEQIGPTPAARLVARAWLVPHDGVFFLVPMFRSLSIISLEKVDSDGSMQSADAQTISWRRVINMTMLRGSSQKSKFSTNSGLALACQSQFNAGWGMWPSLRVSQSVSMSLSIQARLNWSVGMAL